MAGLGVSRCPSGCGRALPAGKLMCRPCWSEVPRELQQQVYRTWRRWLKDLDDEAAMDAYREARDAALGCVG